MLLVVRNEINETRKYMCLVHRHFNTWELYVSFGLHSKAIHVSMTLLSVCFTIVSAITSAM
jgi:hypothetical protein